MAHATTATPAKPDVVLTITHDEAVTLAVVCNHIGGSFTGSRRRHSEDFFVALTDIVGEDEVDRLSDDVVYFDSTLGGALMFKDEEGLA